MSRQEEKSPILVPVWLCYLAMALAFILFLVLVIVFIGPSQ